MTAAAQPSRAHTQLALARGPAAIVAAASAAAATVALTVIALRTGHGVRALLALHLPARSGSWNAVLTVYGHNLAVAAIPLLAALAVARLHATHPGWRRAADLLLAGVLIFNAGRVGAAAGAYGAPLITYMTPHGPLELCAFAIAGAPYLKARTGHRQPGQAIARTALACAAMLALAAVLEVRRGLT